MQVRSILVINPFGIGDVLFSTPLLRNIAANFPQARISYLCNKRSAPLLAVHPLVSKIFVYERDEFAAESKRSFLGGVSMHLRFIRQLRREKFDCCLDLSLNSKFGFFAFLAGIPKRYGLDYKKRGRFLTHKLAISGFNSKHVADYYLDLLRMLKVPVKECGLEVYTDAESDRWAQDFLKQNNIGPTDTIIGIAPCGGDAFGRDNHLKRWPAQNFSLLIDKLIQAYGAKIFIFAGPNELMDVRAIIGSLKNKTGVYDFSESSLEQTVSLVKYCGLFISNDTGLLRFADGLNKKIVALYGPIDEKVYGPYLAQTRSRVITKDLPCRPCYRNFRLRHCYRNRECLKSIQVDEVFAAASAILKK